MTKDAVILKDLETEEKLEIEFADQGKEIIFSVINDEIGEEVIFEKSVFKKENYLKIKKMLKEISQLMQQDDAIEIIEEEDVEYV